MSVALHNAAKTLNAPQRPPRDNRAALPYTARKVHEIPKGIP